MGLFDKLLGVAKEIADGTKTAFEKIERDQEANNVRQVYNNPSEPLPAVPVQTKLHGNNASFMIRYPKIIDELYGGKITVVQLVLTIPNPIDFVKNYDKICI